MKNVVLTSMYGGLGGGEVALLQHARSLRRLGAAVRVVLFEDGPFAQQLEAEGFLVDRINFSFGSSRLDSLVRLMGAMMEARRFLHATKTDLLVSYTSNDFVVFSVPCWMARVPIVLRAQGEYFRRGENIPDVWLGSFFISLIKLVGAHVIPTTRYEEQRFLRAGLPGTRCFHIHLGVQPSSSCAGSRDSSQLPVVSIFGRLVRWKGQDVFLKALGLLKAKGYRFKAYVVGGADFGDGDEFVAELDELVRDYHMNDDVEFLGHRKDVQALMANSDIVCHCSRFEPFGLVVIEAMRARCAVIASDVDGPRESVRDGETGYLVVPDNPEMLAERMAYLLSNPDLRMELGMRASIYAEENFDAESNLGRLNKVCMELAGASSNGSRGPGAC